MLVIVPAALAIVDQRVGAGLTVAGVRDAPITPQTVVLAVTALVWVLWVVLAAVTVTATVTTLTDELTQRRRGGDRERRWSARITGMVPVPLHAAVSAVTTAVVLLVNAVTGRAAPLPQPPPGPAVTATQPAAGPSVADLPATAATPITSVPATIQPGANQASMAGDTGASSTVVTSSTAIGNPIVRGAATGQDHAGSGLVQGLGGWLPVPAAAVTGAAAAWLWAQRRRHYQPGPPGPAVRTDRDLTPIATVAEPADTATDEPGPSDEVGFTAAAPSPARAPAIDPTPVRTAGLRVAQHSEPIADDDASPPGEAARTAAPAIADNAAPMAASSRPLAAASTATSSTASARSVSSALRLRLLGPATVVASQPDGEVQPVRIRRTAGMHALIFLAVHRDGADSEQLKHALWRDGDSPSADGRLATTMSELRRALHDAVGAPVLRHVIDSTVAGKAQFWLDRAHLAVDVWQLQDLLDTAATVTGEHRRAVLRHIADLAAGFTDGIPSPELALGVRADWLAPHREAIARHLIDLYRHLADTEPDPATAVRWLQHAIRFAPHTEALYRDLMRHHARLGDPHAAHRAYLALTERLTELGTQPTAATRRLATILARQPAAGPDMGPGTVPANAADTTDAGRAPDASPPHDLIAAALPIDGETA